MEPYSEFDFSAMDALDSAATGVLGAVLGVLLIVLLVVLAFAVLSYVLGAVGMYRIAKRRGIHHAWLAWIPIGNYWMLGSISDHYQYVARNKNTRRRTVLLVLGIIYSCLSGVMGGVTAGVVAAAVSGATDMVGAMAAMSMVDILFSVLAIVVCVFQYMSYYDLFRSSKPDYAVLFLVLSILFAVTLPFFVIACSNSDAGMPERRDSRPLEPLPGPGENHWESNDKFF